MELALGNSAFERARRSDSVYFQTIMNHDAGTDGRRNSSATGAAGPDAWATTMNEVAPDSSRPEISTN